jgi:hypothetical protein
MRKSIIRLETTGSWKEIVHEQRDQDMTMLPEEEGNRGRTTTLRDDNTN